MTTLPAISLWQPWASLCFTADRMLRKEHETRHWRFPTRLEGATVVMHAAQKLPTVDPDLDLLCRDAFGSDYRRTLPRGALIGKFRLIRCHRVEDVRDTILQSDRIAGNYDDGRFAWQISEAQALRQPIPWRGRQGWFSVERSAIEQ